MREREKTSCNIIENFNHATPIMLFNLFIIGQVVVVVVAAAIFFVVVTINGHNFDPLTF